MVAVEIGAAGLRIPREAAGALQGLTARWFAGGAVAAAAAAEEGRWALEVVPMNGAMTNEVYQVRWRRRRPGAAEEEAEEEEVRKKKVLLRIYGDGTDLFFDRADEVRTFECISRHGQGPRLLARFPNGRIEEFIHARTLSAADLRDEKISALVAAKLREFHDLDMPGPKKIQLWNRLRNWLRAARSLCPPEEAEEYCLDIMEEEITDLENEFSGQNQRIGFCHNDLQYGNIMIDEETSLVTIIDYEYASFNPVAYDIANHFCEMAANYHSEKPHILDYTKYPGFEERKRFVETYLSSSGEEPDDTELENLLETIEKYALASHLVWGLWGLISEHVNDIDFDYMEYARQRFQQYWLKKSLSLV
uniref:Choline kinase 2 n=1 Tax=Ananas comosus var. bracteatus TaxID=296719 RepID=A0A6V7PG91_ANACO|nr:unnamed protein product [Ananas comosus var. bracteatus]